MNKEHASPQVICLGFLHVFLALLLFGCATHEIVLSSTLRPALSDKDSDFSAALFRARVQMDRLEVRVAIERSDGDYKNNFDAEIESAAAICASLAGSETIFKNDWNVLVLKLRTEYGSQWRWRNKVSLTTVSISREALLALRASDSPASDFPKHWHLIAAKIGPPDYVWHQWPLPDEKTNSGK